MKKIFSDIKKNYYKNKELSKNLKNVLKNKKIYLYGAGFLGKCAQIGLNKIGFEVKNFVDDAKHLQKKKINSIKIISKKELLKQNLNNSLIIFTIWNPKNSYLKIKQNELKKSNLVYHYLDIVRIYPKILTKHSMFDDGNQIIKNWQKIKLIYKKLKDKKSKIYFLEYIHWLVNGDFGAQKTKIDYDQYISKGLVNYKNIKDFIDVGAFTGDTFLNIMKNKRLILKRYIAIEPDYYNFKKLKKTTKSFNKLLEVLCINKIVSNKLKSASFINTGKQSSSILKSNKNVNGITSKVKTISIDNIIKKNSKSLVAIDVEGHEYEVLKSAKKTILKANTIFAISVYHRQIDVVRFYNFFRKYLKYYNIHFRVHGHDFVDSLIYFVPKNLTKLTN